MKFLTLFCALLFITIILPFRSFATDLNHVAESVYSEINSPFCKGKLLRDCPSTGASQLKSEVRSLAAEGKGKDEIIKTLYERYGDEIRAVPTASFTGQLAWFVPFLFLTVVLGIMIFWIKRNIKNNINKV